MVPPLRRVTFEERESNQSALPLSFGASPRLGMPSLRSCSVGPPPSAIHGRERLTRHPCRVAHCAEPPLGLSRRRTPSCVLIPPVGASLLAKDVNDNACCLNERGVWTFFASRLAPTGDWLHTVKVVGASLLAMDVNDDAGCLDERGAWAFFASRLAPTGDWVHTI